MLAFTEQLVTEFISLIDDEISAVNELTKLGFDKQKFIIANDIDNLNDLIQKESRAVSKLNRLEAGRFDIQEQLTGFYNMQRSATAAALVSTIQNDDPNFALRLLEGVKQLQTAVNKLNEINRHNDEMIGYSLDYLNFLQSVVEGDVAGVYSDDGQPEEGRAYLPGKKLLDQRI